MSKAVKVVKAKVDLEVATANYKALLAYAMKSPAIWNEGVTWYDDAKLEAQKLATEQIHPVIGGEFTRSVRLAAALLACGSPAKSWEQGVNQLVARRWAAQMGAGIAPKGHFGPNNDKAQALWDAVVNGDPSVEVLSRILTKEESKVSRFFRNILGDTSPMTIDGHMINAGLHGKTFVAITNAPQTAHNVKVCGEALIIAADAYGLDLSIAQAVVWVAYKALKGA